MGPADRCVTPLTALVLAAGVAPALAHDGPHHTPHEYRAPSSYTSLPRFQFAPNAWSLAACDEPRTNGVCEPAMDPRKSLQSLRELLTDDKRTVLPSTGEYPYSVQLHVHGSNSEGGGSMATHTAGAELVGIDALWWSDHDWRMTYHKHASSFSFDGNTEPLDHREPFTLEIENEIGSTKSLSLTTSVGIDSFTAQFNSAEFTEGVGSFRLQATGSAEDFFEVTYQLQATRNRFRRSLASQITLHISMFPEQVTATARPELLVRLSDQPENDLLPYGQYWVKYYLSNTDTEPRRNGFTYHVPIPYVLNEWNHYTVDLDADASAGFPFIDWRDNAVRQLYIGIEARASGDGSASTASARFDDFRMEHAHAGQDTYAIQRQVLDDLESRVPAVRQFQGVELSYMKNHVNEYSTGPVLPDYAAITSDAYDAGLANGNGVIPANAFNAFATPLLSAQIEQRNGIGSYNHPFGTGNEPDGGTDTPEEVSAELRAEDLFGLDAAEFGYRLREGTLEQHLWVYDDLARHGVYIVPLGVSDFHGGDPFAYITDINNFVTWIYTHQPDKAALTQADLIAGLKASRCFIGDPALFAGTMEIDAGAGQRMGSIVMTNRASVDARFDVHGASPGDRFRILRDGAEIATETLASPDASITRTITLEPSAPTTVRSELYGPMNLEKAFSSHLTWIRAVPARGVSAERIVFDTTSFHSTDARALHVTDATITEEQAGSALSVSYEAQSGSITFVRPGGGALRGIVTQGLGSYTKESTGSTLVLDALNGPGVLTVELATACPADCDGSGTVDFNDLICVLFAFGETDSPADVDESGAVDFNDLLAALFQFGPCG